VLSASFALSAIQQNKAPSEHNNSEKAFQKIEEVSYTLFNGPLLK